MNANQRAGAAVALGLAAVAGAVLALRRPPPRDPITFPTSSPGASLPRDPLAYVPASARVLVVADLDALRRAPATRRWFAPEPSGDCRAELARRVRTVALVVPRLPLDDFAFVASGDLAPADLARCVPGAEPVERGGVTLSMVRSRRGDAGAPGAVLAWTPAGVVLVGDAATVDRMLERALDVTRGGAAPLALEPLRRHVREGAAAWALALPGADAAPPDDPLGMVSGGALSADVGEGLSLDGVLVCDDGAHARRAADALLRARDGVASDVETPAVRALVAGARVEAEGAFVRVRASLDAASLDAASDALGALARGLGSFLPTAPPPR